MSLRGIVCGIFLISSLLVSGQNFDKNDYFEADMALVSGDYERAQRIFERLIRQDPDNANLNFLNGLCLLNLPGRKKEALPFLEKAVPKASADYKYGNPKEENAPLESIKQYANALKLDGNITEAIAQLNRYKGMLPSKEKSELALVDELLASCYSARELISTPVYIRRNDLGDALKSDEVLMYPVVSRDESLLFFAQKGKYNDDIFVSRKEAGAWTAPVKITTNLGAKGDCYPTSISADNQRLYLTVKLGVSTDIYVSEFKKEKWQRMVELDKPVNGKDWDSQAYESSDGRYLYFSSDRKGGFGEMDLYRSEKEGEGIWGKPVNLGETVNTAKNELMPVINDEGSILYFKSEGHKNIGGYDIFKAQNTGANSWSSPINLGYPLSTTDDDIHFMPLGDDIFAVAAREDPYTEKYELVMYEIFSDKHPRTFTVSGTVLLQDGDTYDGATIDVYTRDSYQIIVSISPEMYSGSFSFDIAGGNYTINFSKPDYKTNTQFLDLPADYPEEAMILHASLEKAMPVVEEKSYETPPMEIAENTYEPPAEKQDEDVYAAETAAYEEPFYEEPESTYKEPEPVYEEPEPAYKEPEPVYVPVKEPQKSYTYGATGTDLFTVQFMASLDRIAMDFVGDNYRVEVQKGADKYYRYIAGVFNSLEEAENARIRIANSKYRKAFVRFYNLEDYLDPEKTISSSVYTIQFMAMKQVDENPNLLGIPDMKITYGNDGWYRYTSGEFKSVERARAEMERIIGLGYKTAFIRKTEDIQNYR